MAAALVMAASATADQSYTDARGDGGPGTDIVALTVRNDTAGNISIQVQSANPIVENHAIAIFIDADRNPSTGEDGDEYWMYGGPAVGVGFFAWNGSQFVAMSPASFQVGAAASDVTDFRINKADLGNVSGFNFVAISISIDPPNINFWDAAPDRGYYSYDLVSAPPPTTTTTTTTTPAPAVVRALIGAPVASPVQAVAGKRLTVTFPVRRSDNGQPLASGTLVSRATIAGKLLAHTQTFAGGKAQVSLLVPKTAKGKLLTVRITITAGTQSTTKVATFRIK